MRVTGPWHCPHCTQAIACMDIEGDRAPEPGDISVCVYCGAVLVFTEGLAVRAMTHAEFRRACASDPAFVRSISAAYLAGQAIKARRVLQSQN